MSRSRRKETIDPRRVQIIHAISRCTRACRLLGDDPLTGKNCDHRKQWIEDIIKHFAANFAIDVLSYAVLSNHHHQLFRSRPDVVDTWDDTEVARRWLMICPKRKDKVGNPMSPSDPELDVIRNNPVMVEELRVRLSNVSWWMRLLNQRVAQDANKEDGAKGKFFEDRFRGIPVIDEGVQLACSIYIDLNCIRAGMAETIEQSKYTSIGRRFQALQDNLSHLDLKEVDISGVEHAENEAAGQKTLEAELGDLPRRDHCGSADSFLAPINVCESVKTPGPDANQTGTRCSDKGFLSMSAEEYLEVADWSARQVVEGKPGHTPPDYPPVLARLGLEPTVWGRLVADFDDLFSTMAGRPENIDQERGLQTGQRFYVRKETRELFAQSA